MLAVVFCNFICSTLQEKFKITKNAIHNFGSSRYGFITELLLPVPIILITMLITLKKYIIVHKATHTHRCHNFKTEVH